MSEQQIENMANIFKENWLTLIVVGAILAGLFIMTILIITRKE